MLSRTSNVRTFLDNIHDIAHFTSASPGLYRAVSCAGVADRLIVDIGIDMLQLVPGRISTEVDAHLSYDTQVRR